MIFQYFVEFNLLIFCWGFYIYIHQGYWVVTFYFCDIFDWFWYYFDVGLDGFSVVIVILFILILLYIFYLIVKSLTVSSLWSLFELLLGILFISASSSRVLTYSINWNIFLCASFCLIFCFYMYLWVDCISWPVSSDPMHPISTFPSGHQSHVLWDVSCAGCMSWLLWAVWQAWWAPGPDGCQALPCAETAVFWLAEMGC